MKVLVINAGSSSLKYQLIDVDNGNVIAKGLCERIGICGSMLTYKPAGGDKHEFKQDMKDHTDAIRMVLDALVDPKIGVVKSMDEIDAVGHRIVHGGEKFAKSALITDELIEAVKTESMVFGTGGGAGCDDDVTIAKINNLLGTKIESGRNSGFAEAKTAYGRLGVKVWIYKGQVLPTAKKAPAKTEGGK